MTDTTRVLIVDDEPEMLENIDRMLSSEGYLCRTLSDPARFRDVRNEIDPDVVITDLRMPGADGMTILTVARADDSTLPVILITGYGTVSSAVDAMHEGAFDYLTKPFSVDDLLMSVERAARHRALVVENRTLREKVRLGSREETVVGTSPSFVRVVERAKKVATTDANILITGESGTGKEVLARLVHEASQRAEGRFLPVDCAALPEGLLESELFGYQEGAFTGAVSKRRGLVVEADGGTLFLDEIGEMTPPLQSKLLRVLEERQVRHLGDSRLVDVDIRVVAATNANLAEAMRCGDFRQDLYYRLNVVGLELPPLRARREDIPLLASRFLEELAESTDRGVPEVSPEAWRVLRRYHWPGNIRQLRNVIHCLVALDEDGRVTVADLPTEIRFPEAAPNGAGSYGSGSTMDYARAREEADRAFRASYLERLLDAHDGNVSAAAKTAGVSRRSIHRWIAELEGSGEGGPDEID